MDVVTKGLIVDILMLVALGCFTLLTLAGTAVALRALWVEWRERERDE